MGGLRPIYDKETQAKTIIARSSMVWVLETLLPMHCWYDGFFRGTL
jgi:hypothetical protein